MFFGGKFPKSQTKRRQVSRMMRSIAFSDAGSRWEEETLRYFHRNNERENLDRENLGANVAKYIQAVIILLLGGNPHISANTP